MPEGTPNGQGSDITLPSVWEKVLRGGLVFAGKHTITAAVAYILATIFTPTIVSKIGLPGTEITSQQKVEREKRRQYLIAEIKKIEDRQRQLNNGFLPGFLREWLERSGGKGVSNESSVNVLRTELTKISFQESIKDTQDYLAWVLIFTAALWYLTEPIGGLLNRFNENQQKRKLVGQINTAIQKILKRLQTLEERFLGPGEKDTQKFVREAEELRRRLAELEAQIEELRKAE